MQRKVGYGEQNAIVNDHDIKHYMLTYVVTVNEQSFPVSTWILLENHFQMKAVKAIATSSTTSWWR